jgi:tetratricopeptide (TPR) repeat protein
MEMIRQQKYVSIGEALDMGMQFAVAGLHKDACEIYKGVLEQDPGNFEAVMRMGASKFEAREFYEAFYWFWFGLKIDPHHPLSLTNYGLCISQLGHAEEGLPYLERATKRADKVGSSVVVRSLAYNNLGNTYERLGRYEEGLAALEVGIDINPEDPFPHYNRGICLLRLGRQMEALDALDRSMALRPQATDTPSRLNLADALYNRSMAKLLLGDLPGGFTDYEGRLTSSENDTPNLNLPANKKWTGQDLTGKTVLAHGEQGLGDMIQFIRFLPGLVARCDKVKLIIHSALREMCRSIEGIEVIDPGEDGLVPIPKYEHWVALMSLPHMLGLDTEEKLPAPWRPPVEGERIIKWRDRLAISILDKDKPTVVVCWAGNFKHKNNEHRSIPLGVFAKLFAADCNFVSVQQMQEFEREEFKELKKKHLNLTAIYLDDFRDTAAVMHNAHLVISADTSVAHLAGTIGVPTWVLIPKFSTDWRWQLGRQDSPWYPSARLIRQERTDGWERTIAKTKAELDKFGATARVA